MRDKLNNLNAGFDPELLAMGTEMAAYHIEAGQKHYITLRKCSKETEYKERHPKLIC
jgi:hypothetical protein